MENEGVKEGRKEGGRSEQGFSWGFQVALIWHIQWSWWLCCHGDVRRLERQKGDFFCVFISFQKHVVLKRTWRKLRNVSHKAPWRWITINHIWTQSRRHLAGSVCFEGRAFFFPAVNCWNHPCHSGGHEMTESSTLWFIAIGSPLFKRVMAPTWSIYLFFFSLWAIHY